MRIGFVGLALCLLLAGCYEDGSGDGATTGTPGTTTGTGGGPGGSSSDLVWLNQSFDMQFTQTTLAANSNGGANCVAIEGSDPVRILEGTLTATWQPQSPAAEEMEFRATIFGGDHRDASGYSASPLTYEVASLPAAGGDSFYAFALNLQPNSAAVLQTAQVEIALLVEGGATAAPLSCAI